MLAVAIKTHKIKPQEALFGLLDKYIPPVLENTIIAFASKIISTCENNIISKTALDPADFAAGRQHRSKQLCKDIDKMELIRQEADLCFPAPKEAPGFCLTLKNKRLIPNAGLDESNCQNAYILLPKEPQQSAKQIWQYLRNKFQIKNLGIIITDSNVTPLRCGVTGISIGWCGFKPVYNYQGQVDIFKRPLQVTQINLLDSLATIATLCMGEGGEQTPMAILTDVPKISFQNRAPNSQEEAMTCIDLNSDLFSNLYMPDSRRF
jgi:F420-0:gamma-glutamyl ligase